MAGSCELGNDLSGSVTLYRIEGARFSKTVQDQENRIRINLLNYLLHSTVAIRNRKYVIMSLLSDPGVYNSLK